ncbi:hypothetical protein ACOME3_004594 [Neoechinorhynchus agilis]
MSNVKFITVLTIHIIDASLAIFALVLPTIIYAINFVLTPLTVLPYVGQLLAPWSMISSVILAIPGALQQIMSLIKTAPKIIRDAIQFTNLIYSSVRKLWSFLKKEKDAIARFSQLLKKQWIIAQPTLYLLVEE